ncbi:protein kinase [Sorangium cellulosum]|uniref:Protein kinase n=1 Tax=Sorangium cellulosum TaxID=56 RepID=A0A2L0EUD2_SORCE|nr:serine/threonine-protein kinase [Sorangium cellulosum]AUX42889.1 protein kinase [Sorangium cellulosum]
MIGTIIDGKYQIRKLLGEGAMGSVYEAEHTGTGRRCAVKVISSADLTRDPKVVSRFQREARAAGAIDTQHITQVLDAGVDRASSLPFLAMEYLAGEDVHQLIKRVGPLAPDLALRIVAQSCLGLQKAHEASVVHRDIKPHNLFLARRDAGEILVKLLDFGIAKVKMDRANETEGADLTRTGNLIGSPLYMSPEQARGQKEIDYRTDIWSLGAVLYQALTGRTPYHHITALGELIISICSEPPPPVQEFAPWVPPEVAAIVHRCLQQPAGQRYQSAQEMFGAIRPLLPYGWGIHESMLVPLTENMLRQSAPRLSINVPPANQGGPHVAYAASPANQSGGYPAIPPANQSGGYPAIPPANQSGGGYPSVAPPANQGGGGYPSVAPPANQSGPYGAVVPAGNHAGAATTGALTQSQRGTSPGASRAPVVAGAALLAAGIAAGVYFISRPSPEPAAPPPAAAEALPPPAATPTPTAPPPAAPAVTPSFVAAVEPQPKRVQVVILPVDASVEVEGQRATTRNGILDITGPPGSRHRVRVFKGAAEELAEVIVTDTGAWPPKVELAPRPAKGAPAPPAKSAPAAPPPAPTTPKGIIDNTDEFGK